MQKAAKSSSSSSLSPSSSPSEMTALRGSASKRRGRITTEFLALKHTSRILGHSSTLYVVSPRWNRLGSVMFGRRSTGLALPSFLEPDTGLAHCPRILLLCFRGRISDGRKDKKLFLARNLTNDPMNRRFASTWALFAAAAASDSF